MLQDILLKEFIINLMIDTSELDFAMEWLLLNLTFHEYVKKNNVYHKHTYTYIFIINFINIL